MTETATDEPTLKEIIPQRRERVIACALVWLSSLRDNPNGLMWGDEAFVPLALREGRASERARKFIVEHAQPSTTEAKDLVRGMEPIIR